METFSLSGIELSSSEDTEGWKKVQMLYCILCLVEKLRLVIPVIQGLR